MRSEGFRSSLEERGLPVSICGQSAQALFNNAEPEDLATKMDDGSREMCWLHLHREDVAKLVCRLGRKIEKGDIFTDETQRLRVTDIKDIRAYVDVWFLCEVSDL